MGLFSSRKQAPATVPGDRIVPIGFYNDQDFTRAICLDITLCFNSQLDPERLRESLEALLQKEGWQKFGARLRLNADKKLDFHIPEKFDAKRPSVLFSIDKQDGVTVSEHPQFSQVPRGEFDNPTVLESLNSLRPYLRAANTPEVLDDWLYSDCPQLAVHVVVLEDATFITITFIHVLMDAMGLSVLLKGWMAVLRGEEDQIPPILAVDDDPQATIHQITPSSKYVLAGRMLTGWGFFLFVFRYLFDLLWYRKEEERMVCVPGSYLKELRDSVLTELNEDASLVSNGATPPFVSESDVLLAWWARTFMHAFNASPNRPVTLINVFDIRGVLAEMGFLPSADTAYISNVVWPTTTLTTAGEIIHKPLSYLASRIRHAINTQRTAEQVAALVATYRPCIEKSGNPPLFGGPGALLLVCSNWHRGKMLQIDFSPAMVKGVPHSEQETISGKPSFLNVSTKANGYPTRNVIAIMGKDNNGDWWFKASLRADLWGGIEKQL